MRKGDNAQLEAQVASLAEEVKRLTKELNDARSLSVAFAARLRSRCEIGPIPCRSIATRWMRLDLEQARVVLFACDKHAPAWCEVPWIEALRGGEGE